MFEVLFKEIACSSGLSGIPQIVSKYCHTDVLVVNSVVVYIIKQLFYTHSRRIWLIANSVLRNQIVITVNYVPLYIILMLFSECV